MQNYDPQVTMDTNSLKNIFAPKSIAVIGASRREGSLGKMFLDAVTAMNFTGQIYPVNPNATEINNIKCYHDIDRLPEVPDMAVILVGKELVLPTIDQLALKKVENVVVISAGFRETGPEGKKREDELLEKLHAYGMRMIGPNSMGLFNTDPAISLNATFSPTPPIPGHVAFISQSGALGVAVLELSKQLGLGFSLFVSMGNKPDLGDVDVLRYACDDANSSVITLYMESIDKTNEFRREVGRIMHKKPILVLKAGSTASGSRAASSHTGALAASDLLTNAFLEQCGVIHCKSLQELLYSALAFSTQPVPKGNRVAVITNAGGPGILASDALENAGLNMPDFSPDSLQKLRTILPDEAAVRNPVDMIASATHDTYRDVCTIVEQDQDVDAMLVIIVKPPVNTTPRAIISELTPLIKQSDKPFYFVVMAESDYDAGLEVFAQSGVPVFPFPETAAMTIGNMVRYKKIRDSFRPVTELPEWQLSAGGEKNIRQATFEEMAQILSESKIPLAPFKITDNIDEAMAFLEREKKIVIKIANEEVIHKSDLGLVRLNISTRDQLSAAFSDIAIAAEGSLGKGHPAKYLVQKMIPPGIEMILGSNIDKQFGPVIMFGFGGIQVELYRDIVFKVLPLTDADALSMITDLKAAKIFDGFRGSPAIDKSRLADLIKYFAKMIADNPQIIEMDINPLIWPADYDQPVVVDCRMTVTE